MSGSAPPHPFYDPLRILWDVSTNSNVLIPPRKHQRYKNYDTHTVHVVHPPYSNITPYTMCAIHIIAVCGCIITCTWLVQLRHGCMVLFTDDLFLTIQITKATGDILIDLDISNCLALTDQSCCSISRHCVVLEVLGLRNHRDMKGTDLIKFFQNKERARNFRSVTMSGSKNVR